MQGHCVTCCDPKAGINIGPYGLCSQGGSHGILSLSLVKYSDISQSLDVCELMWPEVGELRFFSKRAA